VSAPPATRLPTHDDEIHPARIGMEFDDLSRVAVLFDRLPAHSGLFSAPTHVRHPLEALGRSVREGLIRGNCVKQIQLRAAPARENERTLERRVPPIESIDCYENEFGFHDSSQR
jgi:hypothetical protein